MSGMEVGTKNGQKLKKVRKFDWHLQEGGTFNEYANGGGGLVEEV